MKPGKKYKANWELLSKYICNEASESEIAEIELWLLQDQKNRDLLQNLKEDKIKINTYKSMKEFNTDKGWSKLKEKIYTNGLLQENFYNIQTNKSPYISNINRYLRVAAIIIISVGLSIGAYLIFHKSCLLLTWGYHLYNLGHKRF